MHQLLLTARKNTGMSRHEAAKKLNISYSYLEKLENGYEEKKPSRELLFKMSHVYSFSIDELIKSI